MEDGGNLSHFLGVSGTLLLITTQNMKRNVLCEVRVLRMDGEVPCFLSRKCCISTNY